MSSDGLGCECKLECGVVNAGHVACSGRLVFFRFEAEGVDVDANGRDVGVVLVRLDEIEVATHAFGETVVAIELEFGGEDRVEASVTFGEGEVVAGGVFGGGVGEGEDAVRTS
tara:strand:+ start:150 stop:488 length:339 start_codon:yes stop_codon:yes gene_type:complete